MFLLPFILWFIPLPETPIQTYPVAGNFNFDVFQHKVILSLGAFDRREPSQYGVKRYFRLWTDVPDGGEVPDSMSLRCVKFEYRIDGAEWREAVRFAEGENPDAGSVGAWYWSPHTEHLALIDTCSNSYKMRTGRYDLRVNLETRDGSKETVETTLQLSEMTESRWRSIRKIWEELSGIN